MPGLVQALSHNYSDSGGGSVKDTAPQGTRGFDRYTAPLGMGTVTSRQHGSLAQSEYGNITASKVFRHPVCRCRHAGWWAGPVGDPGPCHDLAETKRLTVQISLRCLSLGYMLINGIMISARTRSLSVFSQTAGDFFSGSFYYNLCQTLHIELETSGEYLARDRKNSM